MNVYVDFGGKGAEEFQCGRAKPSGKCFVGMRYQFVYFLQAVPATPAFGFVLQ